MATAINVGATGNQDIDGLLSGVRWSGIVTYSFPDSASDYSSGYGYGEPTAPGFAQISAAQQTAVHSTMALIMGYTNLNIQFTGTNGADIKLAQSSEANPTAYAYYPGNYEEGGDVWFGNSYNYTNPKLGDYYYLTHIHELGHSFGLKHSQETGGPANVAVPSNHDDLEFSVMSYRSYIGGPVSGGYTNETYGYPQTYMMNDILALQSMYGADYNTNSGNSVYTFSSTTGEMFINGAGQGQPGGGTGGASANRIFRTVWDGGGNDTYDLSNYTTAVTINLNPGASSITSNTQLAYLGNGHYAQGNVYNAYLFNNDARSMIENAIGGSGNDILTGNTIANRLDGGGGNDTLSGGGGNDTFVYHFGGGADTVTDFIAGTGTVDRIDLLGFSAFATFGALLAFGAQVGANTVFNFGGGSTLALLNVSLAGLSTDDFTYAFAPPGPNEAPTAIDLSNATVAENAAGAAIGALTVTDPNGDMAFTFAVSDSRFQIVGVSGNYQLTLKSDVALDYETDPSLTLTVTATDPGGLSKAQDFTITVGDVDGVSIAGTLSKDTIDATHSPAGQSRPTAEDDAIFGMSGNDSIHGLGGNDYIVGGAGSDLLYGDDGNDSFVIAGTDAKSDMFSGGSGTDTIVVTTGTGPVTLATFNAATSSIEAWQGNDDGILGTSSANVFDFSGLTSVTGLTYADAGNGNDKITGTNFDDDLRGGGGKDTLNGGGGHDTLTGGASSDTFVFRAGESNGDTITDFAGNEESAGDQFRFEGYGTAAQGASFTQVDGTHWQINSSDGLVHDVVTISNAALIHASDFLFI